MADALPDADAGVSYYGPGIGADSLDNHQVATEDVDFRFRAAASSTLVSVRWYDIYTTKCAPHSSVDAGTCPDDCAPSGANYACGTGGTMHICIRADDGTSAHLATGADLACVDHPNATAPPYFPLETFPSPPTLVAGELYHVHWHNTDPTPTVNFTSVDTLYVTSATVPRQPTISDTDLAVFRGTTLRPQDTAILQLVYGDGTVQGQGYMEVWIDAPASVSGTSQVRETFTVSGGDRSVHGAFVRVSRTSGTSPLTVRLEQADGTLIEQQPIPSSAFGATDATWAGALFASPHVLKSGTAYHLVLSSPTDTVYSAFGVRRGASYSFVPPTFFGDGFGQFTTDGTTWVGFTQPGGSANNTDADLQLYFE